MMIVASRLRVDNVRSNYYELTLESVLREYE